MHIITGNLAKYKLFEDELKSLNIGLIKSDIDVPEIQGNDFDKVLEEKAKYVYDYYKKPYLVDDSALFLEAYPNFPGVCTKFVLKNLGKEGLISLLQGKSKRAVFKCKIGCWIDNKLFSVEGSVQGVLDFSKDEKEGQAGPLSSWFISEEKTIYGALEHRYRAIRELRYLLDKIKADNK